MAITGAWHPIPEPGKSLPPPRKAPPSPVRNCSTLVRNDGGILPTQQFACAQPVVVANASLLRPSLATALPECMMTQPWPFQHVHAAAGTTWQQVLTCHEVPVSDPGNAKDPVHVALQ